MSMRRNKSIFFKKAVALKAYEDASGGGGVYD